MAQSRYLAGCGAWKTAADGSEDFLGTLLPAGQQLGRRAVLVPMDDISAIKMAEHAAELGDAFLLPEQAGELPRQLADKHALSTICAALGVAHPDTRVMNGPADLRHAADAFGFPLVAKWAKPWLSTAGGKVRSTSVVHSAAEVTELVDRAAGQGGELLLQRYIRPTPHADWFFHGYFDRDSACVFAGTGRKERAYPPTAGLTTLGRWLPNPQVEEVATTMASKLRYAGVLDMDFRYCARDDRYYLLDFNPRVGAQFRLFHDANGLDVVRSAYLGLTGQSRESAPPSYGRTYLVENYDLFQNLMKRRHGRGWWRSLRHANELAWYSKDDMKPFLGMLQHTFRRGLRVRK
ncbi:ATP-grasp domain-containing protein [Nonomuraea sp. NBC_01738]|uniref:carboxylate--amine ligase n=1 Tax=Nonomuraea sp. NBC_01738 TaxID=2976003 RepID=UPI002E104E04|nr:ATP-grasp domain-containing protein [Nonomuraea sp. NBC_01738]